MSNKFRPLIWIIFSLSLTINNVTQKLKFPTSLSLYSLLPTFSMRPLISSRNYGGFFLSMYIFFIIFMLSLFPGDGRWRQVIRRCASVSETGVTGVCNWGVYENGVYWEECYCAEDGCNHAAKSVTMSGVSLLCLLGLSVLYRRVFN